MDEGIVKPVVSSRLKSKDYVATTCRLCRVEIEYIPPRGAGSDDGKAGSKTITDFSVRCASCNRPFQPDQVRQAADNGERQKRRYGTDQQPLETEYYDLLAVTPNATQDEIKKAYRKLALTLHPDKNAGNVAAEERFKSIGMAYQILSDPQLRRKYNEYGAKKEVSPEGGFSDPEELFAQLFGGERFEDIIGVISIGRDMADALKHAPDSTDKNGNEVTNDPPLTEAEKEEKDKLEKAKQEEKEKVRAERVLRLSEALEKKLDDYVRVQDNVESLEKYQEKHRNEAEELKTESYGVEILHAVGFTYIAKSKAYLSRAQSYFGGISGMWHGVKGTVHVLSETVGTLRSAMELKNHFERIEKEEKEGKLTDERRKVLEDQAAEKGMRALWLGAKLEVESVTRDVCDAVLQSASESLSSYGKEITAREVLQNRAVGLALLGSIYCAVRKDSNVAEDYVKVETV